MPKRAVFERSRLELSLNVSVGVHILLVVEQSSLESQARGCAKTPILTVVLLKYFDCAISPAWSCALYFFLFFLSISLSIVQPMGPNVTIVSRLYCGHYE